MLSMITVAAASPDACFCVACGQRQATAAPAKQYQPIPCENTACGRGQVFTAAQLLRMFMREEATPRRPTTTSEECPF